MRVSATRPDEVRRHNLRVVLGELHLRGPLTRAQLTQDTGLNRSTIGSLVETLDRRGLVTQSPPQRRQGAGRPSHVVGPRRDGPYALAVDIDAGQLVVAAVGIGGDVLARRSCTYPGEQMPPAYVVQRIAEACTAVRSTLDGGAWVAGMGVSVPGAVRRRDGRVLVAPNLGWRDVALGELVEDVLGGDWPVVTGNDADLGALAEHRRGSARGVDDVLFVVGRVGVGGGIISGGLPLQGASGLTGEIGHIVIDPTGPRCICGNRGCLETYLGDSAFARSRGRRSRPGTDAVDAVVRAAAAGDPQALRTMQDAASWLGRGLASLASVLNPAVIVIGGHLAALQAAHGDLVRDAFDANMRAAPGADIEIRLSTLGRDSALLGAAEVGFAPLLADPVDSSVGRLRTAGCGAVS